VSQARVGFSSWFFPSAPFLFNSFKIISIMKVIIQNIEAEIIDASGIDKDYIIRKYIITFFVYDKQTKLSGTLDWKKEIHIKDIENRILQLFK
jgi:hypothetical protein